MMKTKRGARNPSALLIPILAFFLTIALLVPMARSADRDLFVGTMPNDDTYNLGGIQRFDGVTGAYLGYFVTPGAGGLSAPLFFIFGPDRNLYISAGASVKRYNGTTGAYLGDFVTFGTEGSTYAAGLAFGPDGNLYVAWWSQPGGWKVARYTPGGAYIDDFVPSANGGTSWVGDLAFGPNGNLYVMDGANGIVRFNGTTGTPLGLLVPIPTGTPYCMVFGPDGNLYVALAPYTVKRYSGTTGADLGTIYSFWPAGVDFGPDGNLYVARRYVNMGGRVDRYNGVNGTYIGQFAVPSGVSTELGIRWSPPFNPDLLAPTASPAQSPAAQGMGWNNSDVTVTWNWADNPGGSGIDPANCTASSASSGEGVITLNAACKDLAGNTGTATYSVKVDKTAPTLNPVVSPNPVLLNGVATATSGAADPRSGLASQNCGPVVTTTAGTKSVTCTATDNAGNTATASASYVVTYQSTGFLPPVSNPPVVNSGTAGKTYPLKWQLRDASGAYIGTLSSVTSIKVEATSCSAFTIDPAGALPSGTTGGTGLRYDTAANHYVYNWATPGEGCYTLFLTLSSGQVSLAYFNLN